MACLWEEATKRYQIIIGDGVEVARRMSMDIRKVREHRIAQKDSFLIRRSPSRWSSSVHSCLHTRRWPRWTCTMAASRHELADLRRAFSGIVSGNVKEDGMRRIEAHGAFGIHGYHDMMQSLDALLRAFVEQRRMKIAGEYKPCYRVIA